ncbi:MAG: MarR family transcriptional regulator [Actinomycetota bacterium]|nr:MarR family transcriptional regulator [Actinomycetota bacterium]
MSAESFGDALEQFFRVMRRARTRAGNLEAYGLSLPQYVVLVPLIDSEALSVSALAAAAGVASPTATRMLDGLVRDGIVHRRASEVDRRSVLVGLTEKGREAVQLTRAAAQARRVELYERLAPREREDAERLLRRLAELSDQAPT